ncbi:hypothetical protein T08_7372 [Trichinella sp. T8]|nr:hypothetical protein T08_7372 [Trichinella sp. T8]
MGKKKNNFHQGDKSTSVSGWKNLHTPGDEFEKETSLRVYVVFLFYFTSPNFIISITITTTTL